MRRILPTALFAAALVAASAGVASARIASEAGDGRPAAERRDDATAPMRAPAPPPAIAIDERGTVAYRTAAALAASLAPPRDATAPTSGGAAATSVSVTATVLPVVFIVVDGRGSVVEVVTNTTDRDARSVAFAARRDSVGGEPLDLDTVDWPLARRALAHARAGTGSVWRAPSP